MMDDEPGSAPSELPSSGAVASEIRLHLASALEEAESPEARYHVRQALQYLAWLESVEDRTV